VHQGGFSLYDYVEMHGQQNIKKIIITLTLNEKFEADR